MLFSCMFNILQYNDGKKYGDSSLKQQQFKSPQNIS